MTTTQQRKAEVSTSRIVTHAHCIVVEQAYDVHAVGEWPEIGVACPKKFR